MYWIAAIIAVNILFALTHIWSGPKNLAASFILGILFSAIFYFTGNIWLAVLLHIGIDLHSGLLGYRVAQAVDRSEMQ